MRREIESRLTMCQVLRQVLVRCVNPCSHGLLSDEAGGTEDSLRSSVGKGSRYSRWLWDSRLSFKSALVGLSSDWPDFLHFIPFASMRGLVTRNRQVQSFEIETIAFLRQFRGTCFSSSLCWTFGCFPRLTLQPETRGFVSVLSLPDGALSPPACMLEVCSHTRVAAEFHAGVLAIFTGHRGRYSWRIFRRRAPCLDRGRARLCWLMGRCRLHLSRASWAKHPTPLR